MDKSTAAGQLRVLIVSSHLEAMGGAEKNVLDLARGLRSRCSIEVAGLHCGPLVEEFRSRGIVVQDLAVKKLVSPRGLAGVLRLARKLRGERFDLVVTYHHDADLFAGFAARLAGVPVISSRRDMGYQLKAVHVWLYRLFNPGFSRIIAVADAVKREIVRTQWAKPSSIVTIHNGIDRPAAVDAEAAKRELGLDPARPVIGMVSSFRRVKGQEFLVRAAVEVLRRRPDAQFVIAGDMNSDYYREVKALIQELGLENDIRCLGARNDVPRVLAAMDIFALPSRLEGFSNALVEAMAAGVPPVAASVGGNAEAVDHGVNGLLFEAGDSGALARHILTLLENPENRRRMAAAAASKAAESFSYQGMLDAVHDLFLEAAGRRFDVPAAPAAPLEAGRRA
jgi:glycosyltransferase involved in cell wall biosynthesis